MPSLRPTETKEKETGQLVEAVIGLVFAFIGFVIGGALLGPAGALIGAILGFCIGVTAGD